MEEMDDDSVAKVAVDAISLSMSLMDEEEEIPVGLLMMTLVVLIMEAVRFMGVCG